MRDLAVQVFVDALDGMEIMLWTCGDAKKFF